MCGETPIPERPVFIVGDIWRHRFREHHIEIKIVKIEKMVLRVDVLGGPKDDLKNELLSKTALNGIGKFWINKTLEELK